ncbi:hypothetical protein A8F94_09530 [Bacillus sp. FJAT-27225]|nr:hypothetical protein A8F94_09530 [Bacillus sp. FJAT-27225]
MANQNSEYASLNLTLFHPSLNELALPLINLPLIIQVSAWRAPLFFGKKGIALAGQAGRTISVFTKNT